MEQWTASSQCSNVHWAIVLMLCKQKKPSHPEQQINRTVDRIGALAQCSTV
jgi:hypothetical protein